MPYRIVDDECPMCGKRHDAPVSDGSGHDIDWYFVCCYLIVWRLTDDGLELELAPGQSDDE